MTQKTKQLYSEYERIVIEEIYLPAARVRYHLTNVAAMGQDVFDTELISGLQKIDALLASMEASAKSAVEKIRFPKPLKIADVDLTGSQKGTAGLLNALESVAGEV